MAGNGDRPYFDVVIFDKASQIVPADAIPAILRARKVVVAGDEHQLPPTNSFAGELVLQHAERRSKDSLGVIAMTGTSPSWSATDPGWTSKPTSTSICSSSGRTRWFPDQQRSWLPGTTVSKSAQRLRPVESRCSA